MRLLTSKGRIDRIELHETDGPFLLERIGPADFDDPIVEWLDSYAEGRHLPFQFDLKSLSSFTRRCLEQLCLTGWGDVVTYSDLAAQIGSPRGARAVGGACRRNPFPLLIPCHRVVAKGGIGGFSLPHAIKKKLLLFEKANIL